MSDTAMLAPAVDLTQARLDYTPKAAPAEVSENYDYDLQRFLRHSSTYLRIPLILISHSGRS